MQNAAWMDGIDQLPEVVVVVKVDDGWSMRPVSKKVKGRRVKKERLGIRYFS